MQWLQGAMLTYGVLNILLGVFGFVKSHTIQSLIAGSAIGILVIGAAALSRSHPKVGYIIAAVITIMVLGMFVPKMMKGEAQWHHYTLIAMSGILLMCLVVGHFTAKTPSP